MKKIILILFLLPLVVFGQRVRDLSTQSTYDGSAYTILDKAGWTTSKKISLNTLTSVESNLRKSNDTITRRGVGLSDAGTYIPDDATWYLTTALMAGYDTNSVMIAMHMLDSILHKVRVSTALWDTGTVASSTIRTGTNNTAIGNATFAVNSSNVALRNGSSAFGGNAVSNYVGSIALGGGTYMTDYGANQSIEMVARGSIKSASDTLELYGLHNLLIPIDVAVGFDITIVGVQTGGGVGATGDGFFQKWSGIIRNDAGTTALIGVVDSTTAKRSTNGYPIAAVTADNTLDALNIIVNSGLNRDYEFTAYIRFTYVGYRNFTLGY
jgi:hypothetical protein